MRINNTISIFHSTEISSVFSLSCCPPIVDLPSPTPSYPPMLPERLASGLETEGMKLVNCTLKLQPHWTFGQQILTLEPGRVTVPMDGAPQRNVQFHGCKIIQLKVNCGFREGERGVAPIVYTIAGPCHYTKGDKRDFEIMMRTKQQSLAMKIPPNGEFDWPDYRAFETCPKCGIRAKPGSKDRYWLLFQPLLQHFEHFENRETMRGMGIRFVCRLTCEECFETMTEDKYVEVMQGGNLVDDVPLLDVVEGQGPITWLRGGQMSARSAVDGVCMNAYQLYGAWEHSGTWQALSDDFTEKFHNVTSIGESSSKLMPSKPRDPSTYWEMDQIPTKEGRKCDGPNCTNVHGSRRAPGPGKKKGKKIRLNECTGCFETMYCSEQCQHAAWPDHKVACKEVQRKREEDEEKGKAQEKLDEEAKLEAALASFVPLSITPLGGGARKKKGKKGGGKKKKGKK